MLELAGNELIVFRSWFDPVVSSASEEWTVVSTKSSNLSYNPSYSISNWLIPNHTLRYVVRLEAFGWKQWHFFFQSQRQEDSPGQYSLLGDVGSRVTSTASCLLRIDKAFTERFVQIKIKKSCQITGSWTYLPRCIYSLYNYLLLHLHPKSAALSRNSSIHPNALGATKSYGYVALSISSIYRIIIEKWSPDRE